MSGGAETVALEAALAAEGVSEAAFARARAVAAQTGDRLETVLVQLGLLPEEKLTAAYAAASGMQVLRARDMPRVPVDTAPASTDFLRLNTILPILREADHLVVAVADPFRQDALAILSHAIGLRIEPRLAQRSEIEAALATLYRPGKPETGGGHDGEGDLARLHDLASEEPIIRLASEIIEGAMRKGASDIHLEPRSDGMHLRLRIDGMLKAERVLPLSDMPALVSRLKIMARLDISERRLPQDGRIRVTSRGRDADLRISTLPSLAGEAIVMRILDRNAQLQSLETLGYADASLQRFRSMLNRPNGIVLLTGPTGSGKTTTLYAALREINTETRKVLTVEDPVEYVLEDAVQVQTKAEIGLTFAKALRAFLRHDPDIVMLGEIRDRETAEIAVQTALTGRLVLSTLHANSALAAVTRLADIGIEPYLISSVVQGVAAQRLVRRLCEHCKTPAALPPDSAAARRLAPLGGTPMKAVGCPDCGGVGYAGRFAIAETVPFSPAIREAVSRGLTAQELEALAGAEGIESLEQSGLRAVAAGLTTLEEVARAAGEI